jgi:hypothetical protein
MYEATWIRQSNYRKTWTWGRAGEPLILGVARGELGEEGKVAWRGDLGALTARGDPPGLGAKCPWHGSAPTSKRFASFSAAVRFSVSGVPKCSLS